MKDERDYNQNYPEDIWSKEFNGKTFLEIVQEQILDNLIMEEVIKQDAISKDIKVDEAKVDEVYKSFQDQLTEDDEIKKFYDEQEIDETFIKKQFEMNILMQEHQARVLEDLGLNEATKVDELLKDYIVEVSAQHILIMPDEAEDDKVKADADAKAKAEEVLAKVKAGEDFGELAKEYSQDPGSAENGGELGYFVRGTMVQEFEKASFELNEGEISDLVKTDYGYHIIKVLDKKNLEDIKAEKGAEAYITARTEAQYSLKQNELLEYYDELESKAEIVRYPENIK